MNKRFILDLIGASEHTIAWVLARIESISNGLATVGDTSAVMIVTPIEEDGDDDQDKDD